MDRRETSFFQGTVEKPLAVVSRRIRRHSLGFGFVRVFHFFFLVGTRAKDSRRIERRIGCVAVATPVNLFLFLFLARRKMYHFS